jgi:molybdopterin synthase catalytic subunit
MIRRVHIIREPIDESALLQARRMSPAAGAAVYFAGVVREREGAEAICALDYESFERMAEHQFQLILDELATRWPVEAVRVIHRIGRVPVNAASLWIEVIAPHRQEAFAACQYLIDEMKQRVPIWKKPVS